MYMYILRVNVNVYIFSSCRSMGQEASVLLNKLADTLATKRNENYNHVIGCLQRCLPSHWQGQLSVAYLDLAQFLASLIIRHQLIWQTQTELA